MSISNIKNVLFTLTLLAIACFANAENTGRIMRRGDHPNSCNAKLTYKDGKPHTISNFPHEIKCPVTQKAKKLFAGKSETVVSSEDPAFEHKLRQLYTTSEYPGCRCTINFYPTQPASLSFRVHYSVSSPQPMKSNFIDYHIDMDCKFYLMI